MTIDSYILAQDEAIQPELRAVRDTIRARVGEAEERMSWQMPTWWRGHNLIHFSAQKHHVGVYPGPEAVEAFANRLKDYKTSKGAIQLPNNKDLPRELIAEIARWSYDNNSK
jgi:uncharacterized protein YdhG (YjbR/CyaY superfamily)